MRALIALWAVLISGCGAWKSVDKVSAAATQPGGPVKAVIITVDAETYFCVKRPGDIGFAVDAMDQDE